MHNSYSKKANAFLQTDNRDVRSVFAKIKELEELNRNMSAYLDAGIKDYCYVANRIGNRLIIIVANGSIATQLHFKTADLLKKFKQDPILQKIQNIHYKVRPALMQAPSRQLNNKTKKMQLLSSKTAGIIREIAESLADPKLKEVMERIAGRTATPQSK